MPNDDERRDIVILSYERILYMNIHTYAASAPIDLTFGFWVLLKGAAVVALCIRSERASGAKEKLGREKGRSGRDEEACVCTDDIPFLESALDRSTWYDPL
jgi:hypothetical protein